MRITLTVLALAASLGAGAHAIGSPAPPFLSVADSYCRQAEEQSRFHEAMNVASLPWARSFTFPWPPHFTTPAIEPPADTAFERRGSKRLSTLPGFVINAARWESNDGRYRIAHCIAQLHPQGIVIDLVIHTREAGSDAEIAELVCLSRPHPAPEPAPDGLPRIAEQPRAFCRQLIRTALAEDLAGMEALLLHSVKDVTPERAQKIKGAAYHLHSIGRTILSAGQMKFREGLDDFPVFAGTVIVMERWEAADGTSVNIGCGCQAGKDGNLVYLGADSAEEIHASLINFQRDAALDAQP